MNGLRVIDVTGGIAGPYCTKLLADAGADVLKVEPVGGDSLRQWRSGGLYEYLNGGKRVALAGEAPVPGDAHVVVHDDPNAARAMQARQPELIVVTITPFGADGPWADKPATELTLQAACGSMGSRGLPERPPVPVGGRLGEWLTGLYAAVATAAVVGIGPGVGPGQHVDVAMLDCMAVSLVTYPSLFASLAGWPPLEGTGRTIEVPSVEPTADGFVVFTTNSAQQFQDFGVLIGRPDLGDDPGLARAQGRFARRTEFLDAVHRYTKERTSGEVLEQAGLLRIPAGPVLDGSTVADFEQFVARKVFTTAPGGRFRQPRPPYRMVAGGEQPRPAPGPTALPPGALPLAGVRVLDCTAWWAGPHAAHTLACLGADVVKVESPGRPDLMRTSSVRPTGEEGWWEWSGVFHGANSSKRGVTLDLSRPEGVELFERLARQTDVVIENNTPRVMDRFGLGWERLHQLNPRLVMVRMPAFGLDGPWRDRTGFAQTMECISGMAWVTGFPEGPPVLPRGACDPLAGEHAVFAALLALRARAGDGRGRLVEATMVEAALNVAAEQVIEWDVTGTVLGRQGARDGVGAPQGVYRCTGEDRWVAIAAVTDEQWRALRREAGIAEDPAWVTADGRRRHADAIDEQLAAWCAVLDAAEVEARLVARGVAAAVVIPGRELVNHPQLRHRALFETVDHPVTGRHELPGLPFRVEGVDRWIARPAPTLGQHNDEVLSEVASAEELDQLRTAGVIGEKWITA
jgi:crotonobetainyl-CoA:carnitine CoA-transferase CaiB-like acyl-CoA transferase